PGRARRRIVRGLSAAPELSRWALQAGKARLACCLPDRDVAVLHRAVGPPDPVDPRLSRRMTGGPHGATAGNAARDYRAAANGANTSRQAGDRSAARLAMHCMMRPPPGATPAHSVRMSPPQADRITNSSSRGSIGRSTITVGAAAGAAPPAGAAAAAGALPAAGAAPPLAAVTAFSQPAESFAL